MKPVFTNPYPISNEKAVSLLSPSLSAPSEARTVKRKNASGDEYPFSEKVLYILIVFATKVSRIKLLGTNKIVLLTYAFEGSF